MKMKIKYPVKLGFKDKSGKDENWITDFNDNVLVNGWGGCLKTGGIKDRKIGLMLIKILNKEKPIIYFNKGENK